METKQHPCDWPVIYAYSTNAFVFIASVVLIVLHMTMKGVEDTQINVLRQIRPDWETVPFVDITVTDAWSCPAGTTEVFTRVWFGLQRSCDCLGICTSGNEGSCGSYSYTLTQGSSCEELY